MLGRARRNARSAAPPHHSSSNSRGAPGQPLIAARSPLRAKAAQRLSSQARDATDAVSKAWLGLDEELRVRICGAAGTYRWQSGRFARTPLRPPVLRAPPDPGTAEF